jgi:Sigma-70, region 4
MRVEIIPDDTPTCQLSPELSIYRKTTEGVLRKFFRMSLELGHLPSLLGRQFFRTHVTSYTTYTFEDAVIFTHDVERCLEALPDRLRQVLAHVVFEEYTPEETAEVMNIPVRTSYRWYGEALDRTAEVLVRHKLMELVPMHDDVLNDVPKKNVSSTSSHSARALETSKYLSLEELTA